MLQTELRHPLPTSPRPLIPQGTGAHIHWAQLMPTPVAISLVQTHTGSASLPRLLSLSSRRTRGNVIKGTKTSQQRSCNKNTEAPAQRTLGVQYEDQKAGPPENTCQQLGTLWSPVTQAFEFSETVTKREHP